MTTRFRRVLLVEDDANDVELTLNALSDHGMANQVDVVRDGAEALEYLFCSGNYAARTTGLPAVVLLDIKLPKIDGVEVLRRIKSDSALRVVPVVMLTSSREELDLFESYRLGANAFVVKPVEFTSFVDAVKQVGAFWAVVNEPPPGWVTSGIRASAEGGG